MQVPDTVRKCVAFACFKVGDGYALAGTVFFVAVSIPTDNSIFFAYIVTARHVIEHVKKHATDGQVWLRVNTTAGSSAYVSTPLANWMFHPNDKSVDVAVLSLMLPIDRFDYMSIPLEMVMTDKVIKSEGIGVGDEVFLTGLFSSHYGRQKNLPIVRVGNIALMPDERVHTDDLGPIDAYLVEARSIGGLSGSPVFLYTGASRVIGKSFRTGAERLFYWMGLMHGHWESKLSEDASTSDNALLEERLNMGIAIVVPVSKILEVINQDSFRMERERIISEKLKAMAPVADVQKPMSDNLPAI